MTTSTGTHTVATQIKPDCSWRVLVDGEWAGILVVAPTGGVYAHRAVTLGGERVGHYASVAEGARAIASTL